MKQTTRRYKKDKFSVIYLPIYMCYLLKEQKLGQMIVDLDFAGL